MDATSANADHYRVLQVDPLAHPAVITAAYRALARLLHPDQSQAPTEFAMARLNRAYAVLRDPEQRRAYDTQRAKPVVAPQSPQAKANPAQTQRPVPSGRATGSQLTFGRYQGWTLGQLASHDPDYLRWLARHTSGRQHWAEIQGLLANRKTTAA